jgi:hypothetical protein
LYRNRQITTNVKNTIRREERDFSLPPKTDYDLQFEQFFKQSPKSRFKKLILGTVLLRKVLERMSDKSCPKGLKPFEVERGHTRELPIPYIPVSDDMAEAVTKTSGALGYKLDLPSGIKVTHALWENANAEAFLKHVMAAMSYVARKGYIKEYEAAKRDADQSLKLKLEKTCTWQLQSRHQELYRRSWWLVKRPKLK